jgi:hypothetical protein
MDTQNPDRGPLLLISCQKDHMVPDVATRANYKLYGESTAVTDLKQFSIAAIRSRSTVTGARLPTLRWGG